MLALINRFWSLPILLFALLYSTESKAQRDTLSNSIFALAFEPGVFLPRNPDFQEIYKTKSSFAWAITVEFGKSSSPVLPWIKYSQSKFSIDTLYPSVKDPGRITASKRQYAAGISCPFPITQGSFIQTKFGVSYNHFKETSTDFYKERLGLLFSLGYLKKLSRDVHFYSDVTFDYASTNTHLYFRDWSGFVISTGFNITLISH